MAKYNVVITLKNGRQLNQITEDTYLPADECAKTLWDLVQNNKGFLHLGTQVFPVANVDLIEVLPLVDESHVGFLSEEDVQWIVTSEGDLGVKIHNQIFTLYKGNSLLNTAPDKQWRPVEELEFGECVHPCENYSAIRSDEDDPHYTYGSGWRDLNDTK